MVIILEGNEGTFKSTIANKIIEMFPEEKFEYVHGSSFESATSPNEDLFKYHIGNIYNAIGKNVVMDRSYISNLVYADLYKYYSILQSHQVRVIQKLLQCCNTLVIYMHDNPKYICERIGIRGDDYIENKIEKFEEINDKYDEVLNKYDVCYTMIRCSDFTDNVLNNRVGKFINTVKSYAEKGL